MSRRVVTPTDFRASSVFLHRTDLCSTHFNRDEHPSPSFSRLPRLAPSPVVVQCTSGRNGKNPQAAEGGGLGAGGARRPFPGPRLHTVQILLADCGQHYCGFVLLPPSVLATGCQDSTGDL